MSDKPHIYTCDVAKHLGISIGQVLARVRKARFEPIPFYLPSGRIFWTEMPVEISAGNPEQGG